MGLYSSVMIGELMKRPKSVSDFTQTQVGQAMQEAATYVKNNPALIIDVALIASGGGMVAAGRRMQVAGWNMASRRQGIKMIEKGYRKKLKGTVLTMFGLERQADDRIY
jgi:hypothetical protein